MKLITLATFLVLVPLVLSKPSGVEIPNATGSERVIGGVNAKPNEFPYQVSLQKYDQHFCGGSIISEVWVVTAGHCHLDGDLEVVAGEHDFSKESGREQRRAVVEFIVHENFDGGVGPNDIAVVKVDEPLEFNKYVKAINLPEPDNYPTGKAMLSGWGSISRKPGTYPDILQKANLPIHSQEKCSSLWDNSPYSADSNLCAGPLSGSQASCSGDSGGPLAQKSGSEWTLVGVVSWGQVPCGSKNAPGVFAEVSKYIDWISEKTQ